MRSSARRRQRRGPSRALAILGNILLVLFTLGVGAVAVYLVLYPPGVLDPASQDGPLPTVATGDPAAPATPIPATGLPLPPPVAAGQLSLFPACAAVSPLLTRADEVRTTAIENSDALNTDTISELTRDLQTVSDVSPDELDALIDPLTVVLVELNNAVLAGEENPEIDSEVAEGSTDAIRVLCDEQ